MTIKEWHSKYKPVKINTIYLVLILQIIFRVFTMFSMILTTISVLYTVFTIWKINSITKQTAYSDDDKVRQITTYFKRLYRIKLGIWIFMGIYFILAPGFLLYMFAAVIISGGIAGIVFLPDIVLLIWMNRIVKRLENTRQIV